MTELCVPIFVESVEQWIRDATLARGAGATIIELRFDRLPDSENAIQFVRDHLWLLRDSPLPVIATMRSASEGGEKKFSDALRLDFLGSWPVDTARYVDVELATLQLFRDRAKDLATRRLIVSSHDFKGRPDRLYNIIDELNGSPSNVNKLVWMARSIRDNIEAFEILQTRQKPTIALCMGEAGLVSRVLSKKFGGFLTFAGLTSDSGTAPGQVSIHDMKRLYRWDKIGPATRVYGV